VGPRAGLDAVENRKMLSLQGLEPVTDSALPTLELTYTCSNNKIMGTSTNYKLNPIILIPSSKDEFL
jgi:hypothetical protein